MGMTGDAAGDRRVDGDLVFEPDAGRLRLGGLEVELPRPAGNREVLQAYVELVSASRGAPPGSSLEVRSEDVAGLSTALDLDGSDLRVLIEEVLSTDTGQAVGLLIRLLQHRLVASAALAAVGVAAVGALAVGSSAPRSPAPPRPVRPSTARTALVAGTPVPAPLVPAPLVQTESGVGLIPPQQQDADGVVLVPAEQLDAPAAG